MNELDLSITIKQMSFIESKAFETLFGGAAGGGKSYGQLIDSLLFAVKYKNSKQIIFRRTFADLEKSLIRVSLELYPRKIASYNSSKHTWKFNNGSIIDFGYIDNENDVYQYQSAEYDIIRFDELTHFTEYMYVYMISRCRGANPYPKGLKSSTNPGGIGHSWVKERFIDIGVPNKVHECKLLPDKPKTSTRIFIPSLVTDNKFMLKYDPDYIDRLDNLPEKERQALKYGDWDIYDGMFFPEFKRRTHVIEPFSIPEEWYRYVSIDYGLDKFAVLFHAVDTRGRDYIYCEIHESNLIASDAAKLLKSYPDCKKVRDFFAPPDLWNRNRDTGKSAAEIFFDNGIDLTKCSSDRVNGWLAVKEWIKPYEEQDEITGEIVIKTNLYVFNTCLNLIRCLPAIQHDDKNPNDVAKEPHELTHITDSLRYFCVSRPSPTPIKRKEKYYAINFESERPKKKDYGEKITIV